MAGLKSLIKLKRHQLDDKRRVVNELLTQDDMLEREVNRLSDEMVKEQAFAQDNYEASLTIGAYLKRVLNRQKIIEATRIKLGIQIEKAQDELQNSFKEMKTLEITETERDKRAAAKMARQERMELDDIGLELHRRQHSSTNE